jgi:hypothetical protein
MGTDVLGRPQLTRAISILAIALLALAATGAVAGTYPPNPAVWGELSCQPEDVAAGDQVTCTIDGLDPENGGSWYFDVQRHSDDDEYDADAEVFSTHGDLEVADDGTASFTVQIPTEGPSVGDLWFAYAHQRSDDDSCYALLVDNDGEVVEYLAGPAPFTWLDDEGTRFEMEGVEYDEGDTVDGYVTVQCDGGFHASVQGVIVASTSDAGNGTTNDTTESDATGSTTKRGVTPIAVASLPQTGAGAALLTLIGALALLTGVGALRGPQLLARIRRS